MSGSAAAASLALFAGLAGSVQVAVMARLGDRVGTAAALTFATALTAVLAAIGLLLVRRSLDGFVDAAREPPWLWSGAVMSLLIVFTITFAGARIGTAATVGVLIAGQLAMGRSDRPLRALRLRPDRSRLAAPDGPRAARRWSRPLTAKPLGLCPIGPGPAEPSPGDCPRTWLHEPGPGEPRPGDCHFGHSSQFGSYDQALTSRSSDRISPVSVRL